MVRQFLMAATVLVVGCGDDKSVDDVPDAPQGCAADELIADDGSCLAPGISPELCGEGFEADGASGCRPILPGVPCTGGTKATLGQASCMPIAPCGTGRWGDVEVPRAQAILSATVVENNARAGIANFGGDVGFGDSTFSCNAVALNGETDYTIEANHGTFTFDDRGGNRCGCGEATASCEPVTQLLELPDSAPAPTQP